jgi:transposase-like protein
MKRTFSREFKLQVARQVSTGEQRLAQLCREHSLCQTLVRKWKQQYELFGDRAWPVNNGTRVSLPVPEPTAEERIATLEAALGRAHLEIELLQRALKKGVSAPGRNGR